MKLSVRRETNGKVAYWVKKGSTTPLSKRGGRGRPVLRKKGGRSEVVSQRIEGGDRGASGQGSRKGRERIA